MTYTAANGDTWDSIAFKFYGDEFLFLKLHAANERKYPDVVMFEGGEVVDIPDNLTVQTKVYKAPWSE